MKRLFLAIATVSILAAACKDSAESSTDNQTAVPNLVQEAGDPSTEGQTDIVTGFKSPELAGLAVRDHRDGVQVVIPPTKRRGTRPYYGTDDMIWAFEPKAVFTSVNDMPARDARHFRELMDSIQPGAEAKLGQKMYLQDVGEGRVKIRSVPPEAW